MVAFLKKSPKEHKEVNYERKCNNEQNGNDAGQQTDAVDGNPDDSVHEHFYLKASEPLSTLSLEASANQRLPLMVCITKYNNLSYLPHLDFVMRSPRLFPLIMECEANAGNLH